MKRIRADVEEAPKRQTPAVVTAWDFCETCPSYLAPIKKLIYPNVLPENDKGWVRCAIGSTTNRTIRGCQHYGFPVMAHKQVTRVTHDDPPVTERIR